MKQKLRKKYKQIRKGIPDKAMKSLQIANKLKNHFNYQQSNHIAFYSWYIINDSFNSHLQYTFPFYQPFKPWLITVLLICKIE